MFILENTHTHTYTYKNKETEAMILKENKVYGKTWRQEKEWDRDNIVIL